MQWDVFIKTLHDADKRMSKIRNKLPQYHNFLNKSYLVITYNNKQIDFKKEFSIRDIAKNIDLLKDSQSKDQFADIISCLKETQVHSKNIGKTSSSEIYEQIKSLKLAISSFPLKELEIIDDFDIQIIFPSINVELIQKAKKLSQNQKTCMCLACIRVFLV